jgi:hypothetical protein
MWMAGGKEHTAMLRPRVGQWIAGRGIAGRRKRRVLDGRAAVLAAQALDGDPEMDADFR